jgi:hypothetical protein
MGGSLAAALASLDVGTLFFIAICVTILLGLFLLHAWLQEGNRALAWWSLAYLIGGASGVLWRFGDAVASVLPAGNVDGADVHCRWHDLERSAFASRPPGTLVRHGVRRGLLDGRVLLSGLRRVGRFAHRGERNHCRRLHLLDRGRVAARASQIADPALAGHLCSDAARRDLLVSRGARHSLLHG